MEKFGLFTGFFSLINCKMSMQGPYVNCRAALDTGQSLH